MGGAPKTEGDEDDEDAAAAAAAAAAAGGEAVAKSFKCSVCVATPCITYGRIAAAGTLMLPPSCHPWSAGRFAARCGKELRDSATVQLHAVRTGHEEFEESTTEIAPLTEEQKKEQLARLREKAAERRAQRELEEREAEVKREQERRKLGKVSNEVQQKYMEQMQARKLEEEKRKRQEELAYKEKLRQQLEQDKAERAASRRKVDAGTSSPVSPAVVAAPAAAAAAAPAPAAKRDFSECRIQVRLTNNQTITATFSAVEPLSVALAWITSSRTDGQGAFQLMSTFPRYASLAGSRPSVGVGSVVVP